MMLRTYSMLSNNVILGLCAFAVIGCSGSSKNKLQTVESLDGNWENGCQNNGINNPFSRYRYDVAQAAFDLIVTRYSDPQCASADYQVVYSGTIVDRDKQALTKEPGSAAAPIDIRFESVSLTTLSQAQVSAHNSATLCEVSDWVINVSYDVSGCAAIPLSSVPYNEFNVYSVADATDTSIATHVIYLGALSGTTVEDRPSEVDLGNPFYGNLVLSQ